MAKAVRAHDLVGRTGQAEFGLLLPDTDADAAQPALERLLVELEIVGEGSIGAAGASMDVANLLRGMSPEGLVASARMACAHAQGMGGGRAVNATEPDASAQEGAGTPQQDAIEALAVALLKRDRYTGEHCEAVIDMSAAVARNLGCSATEVERVKSAALLHDIGKVAIPDEILHKPGPLTDDEWKLMKEHPVIGDQIPLGSRIIIAADTYHAITSDRPYRAAASHSDAVEELSRCAGTQFDPQVTAALIGHLYGRRQGGIIAR